MTPDSERPQSTLPAKTARRPPSPFIAASTLYIVEREARLARARGEAAAQDQVLGSLEAAVIIVRREEMP